MYTQILETEQRRPVLEAWCVVLQQGVGCCYHRWQRWCRALLLRYRALLWRYRALCCSVWCCNYSWSRCLVCAWFSLVKKPFMTSHTHRHTHTHKHTNTNTHTHTHTNIHTPTHTYIHTHTHTHTHTCTHTHPPKDAIIALLPSGWFPIFSIAR